LIEINGYCRANKVGFILSETLGAAGYTFLDYGDQHIITDHDGSSINSLFVANISNEEQATVTLNAEKYNSFS
jgi:hypothetical protein